MLGLDAEDWHYLAVRLSLFTGMLAIGVAAGAAIGLVQVQYACTAVGALPEPGTEMTGGAMLADSPCWQSALFLQDVANYSGYSAAILLLGGAVLDQYPEKVQEVFA